MSSKLQELFQKNQGGKSQVVLTNSLALRILQQNLDWQGILQSKLVLWQHFSHCHLHLRHRQRVTIQFQIQWLPVPVLLWPPTKVRTHLIISHQTHLFLSCIGRLQTHSIQGFTLQLMLIILFHLVEIISPSNHSLIAAFPVAPSCQKLWKKMQRMRTSQKKRIVILTVLQAVKIETYKQAANGKPVSFMITLLDFEVQHLSYTRTFVSPSKWGWLTK